MPMKNAAGSPEWTDPDDAPELTEEMLDQAEVFEGNTFVRRGRGRPKSDAAKVQISVRLDADVVTQLRATGPGWQSQINALLRESLTEKGGAATVLGELAGQLKPASLKKAPARGTSTTDSGFTPPPSGTFTAHKTKMRQPMNPRAGDPVTVKGRKNASSKPMQR